MAEEVVIFDEDLKERVKEALRLADRLRREITRAQQVGLDVSDLQAQLNEAQATLRRIQQVYGGTRTPR